MALRINVADRDMVEERYRDGYRDGLVAFWPNIYGSQTPDPDRSAHKAQPISPPVL